MKALIVTVSFLFACVAPNIQKPVGEPPSAQREVPIWPSPVPAGRTEPNRETTVRSGPLVAGRPWLKLPPGFCGRSFIRAIGGLKIQSPS
jgi:hypothetical protein